MAMTEHERAVRSIMRALIQYEHGQKAGLGSLAQAELDRYRSTVEAMYPVYRSHILRELADPTDPTKHPLQGAPSGIIDIAAERRRQVEAEGYTATTDDVQNPGGELAAAAACYVAIGMPGPPPIWPWSRHRWRPRTRREDLVRAGALIAAEIDRLDRAASSYKAEEDAKAADIAALVRHFHPEVPAGGAV